MSLRPGRDLDGVFRCPLVHVQQSGEHANLVINAHPLWRFARSELSGSVKDDWKRLGREPPARRFAVPADAQDHGRPRRPPAAAHPWHPRERLRTTRQTSPARRTGCHRGRRPRGPGTGPGHRVERTPRPGPGSRATRDRDGGLRGGRKRIPTFLRRAAGARPLSAVCMVYSAKLADVPAMRLVYNVNVLFCWQ